MKITTEVMNAIYRYKQHGDLSIIAGMAGLSVPTIHRCIKHKSGSEKAVMAIAQFYATHVPLRQEAERRMAEIEKINESIQNAKKEKHG